MEIPERLFCDPVLRRGSAVGFVLSADPETSGCPERRVIPTKRETRTEESKVDFSASLHCARNDGEIN